MSNKKFNLKILMLASWVLLFFAWIFSIQVNHDDGTSLFISDAGVVFKIFTDHVADLPSCDFVISANGKAFERVPHACYVAQILICIY